MYLLSNRSDGERDSRQAPIWPVPSQCHRERSHGCEGAELQDLRCSGCPLRQAWHWSEQGVPPSSPQLVQLLILRHFCSTVSWSSENTQRCLLQAAYPAPFEVNGTIWKRCGAISYTLAPQLSSFCGTTLSEIANNVKEVKETEI